MVYTFECCCSNSYIGQTSRHLKNIIKEDIPDCVRDLISNQPKIISIETSNAMNRYSIPENSIKNLIFGKNYNEMIFRILRSFYNIFVLIKI